MERRFEVELVDSRYGGGRYETKITIPDFDNIHNNTWRIGALYGPSGTGKSTILMEKFRIPEYKIFQEGKPIDNINQDVLIAVGMMSIPSWYTQVNSLSGGEKERYKIACILTNSKEGETIILDEFTSLVDRATAKGMARGIGKWCRNNGRRLIIASINDDIFPFLKPDFIWSTRYNKFIQHTEENLQVEFVRGSYDDWKLFEKYHYLSTKLFTASTVTLALINNEPVAFVAVSFQMKHGRRIHRLVVLPEWQGLGIGSRLLEYVACEENKNGTKVYIKTSHPAIGKYLESSNKWTATMHNLKTNTHHPWYNNVRNIPCWCYRYDGTVKHLKLIIHPPPLTIHQPTQVISPFPQIISSVSQNALTAPIFTANYNEVCPWDCLIRKGKVELKKNKYAYIRKNYQTSMCVFDTHLPGGL